MSDRPKAVYIRVEYEDGSADFAEGEAAAQIKKWWDGCEVMSCIHGAKYNGPKLSHKDARP